jgi:hypothetical protein
MTPAVLLRLQRLRRVVAHRQHAGGAREETVPPFLGLHHPDRSRTSHSQQAPSPDFSNQQRHDRRSIASISPSFSALVEEGRDRRSASVWAGRLIGEQRAAGHGAGRPHDTIADQPGQPTVGVRGRPARHRFEACDRAPAVDNQNRRTALQTSDQSAELVFGFGYTGLLHLARIALSTKIFKLVQGLAT